MADANGVKPEENQARDTKLLDELEKGPWPSFVTEIKAAAETNEQAGDLLGQLELSYEDKVSHWKHGGLVGVLGYGGGVIGRYSDVGEEVSQGCALSYVACKSAGRLVLFERSVAHYLRHLGAAWLGADEHAWFYWRHDSAGHHHGSA